MATIIASEAIVAKAGAKATVLPESSYTSMIDEAEAFLIGLVKYDFVSNWAEASGAATAPIFKEYAARSGAVEVITNDMSVYTDRIEAEDMIEVHIWNMKKIIVLLEADGVQDFMGVNK